MRMLCRNKRNNNNTIHALASTCDARLTSGGAVSSAQQASNNPASQLLNLLVQSVGVSLTEVQDGNISYN